MKNDQAPETRRQRPVTINPKPDTDNEHPVSNIQHPVSSIQHPVSSIQHPVSSIQHPVSSIQHPVSSIRPFIVPIFLPHAGCPHRCVFCNQVSITGSLPKTVNADQIRSQIHQFLSYKKDRRKPVQISFFGGNFLGLKTDQIKCLLDLATEFVRQGQADSIRFSTRPDTIDSGRLDMIHKFPVVTVELGAQSMDDHVLSLSRRGHRAADTVQAAALLKQRDYELGLQIMVGLPGDDRDRALATARRVAALNPDFVRIYPTLVLKGSLLARCYQKGAYTPLSLDDAVNQVKTLYLFFRKKDVRVIRMGLQASVDLEQGAAVIAGPYHPAFGHLVYSEVFLDKVEKEIESAALFSGSISIRVNPNKISTVRGIQNRNIHILREKYGFESIEVKADDSIKEDQLKVSGHR